MPRLSPILLLAALAASGCAKKIGDPCQTNVDCSAFGDRFCDVSVRDGYCTVEGCDVTVVDGEERTTCPDDAVCVRFFTPLASSECTILAQPACKAPPASMGCAAGERCVCDKADPANPSLCVGAAHCAPESSERRSCLQACDEDSDCRDEHFECRELGTSGAQPVPTTKNPCGARARFCAPKGS